MGGGAQNWVMTASDKMEVTFPVTEEAECHCGGMLVTLFGLASFWGIHYLLGPLGILSCLLQLKLNTLTAAGSHCFPERTRILPIPKSQVPDEPLWVARC